MGPDRRRSRPRQVVVRPDEVLTSNVTHLQNLCNPRQRFTPYQGRGLKTEVLGLTYIETVGGPLSGSRKRRFVDCHQRGSTVPTIPVTHGHTNPSREIRYVVWVVGHGPQGETQPDWRGEATLLVNDSRVFQRQVQK